MTLSLTLAAALRQLSRKTAGEEVGWTDIAAAAELTALGLAIRTHQGWRITPLGEEALTRTAPAAAIDNLIPFREFQRRERPL